MLIKGILSFPTLFTPKIAKGATEPKFSLAVLLPPADPQIATIQAEVDTAAANTFPSGFPAKGDKCFMTYDEKYRGKEYYDPRFSGWYVFTCTAKADDRPKVVRSNFEEIIDPSAVCSGMIGHVHAGISGYTKGTGGVGGWLNGVMTDCELSDMGRLDNKPTVDQMFAGVMGDAPAAAPTPAPAAPVPAAPVPPAAPAPQPQYVMTDKAGGFTREQYIASGWSDEKLIAEGMMLPPNGITPSFG